MAVTQDDTTQGAVAPKPVSPGGAAPVGNMVSTPHNASGATGSPQRAAQGADGVAPLGHIEQLIKTEPGISQYALRAAIVQDALGRLSHGDNPLKQSFADFLKTLTESLRQGTDLQDLMEAALAKRLGGTGQWIEDYVQRIAGYTTEDEQGPTSPWTHQAKAELDQRNPEMTSAMQASVAGGPQMDGWTPEALLREWLHGPSAAYAFGNVQPIKAEVQGQGVPDAIAGGPLGA